MRPSELLGLQRRDDEGYVAYCLDQAVGHFGVSVEVDLENAGHRPSKEERKMENARKQVLARYFGDEVVGKRFADPAAMMS